MTLDSAYDQQWLQTALRKGSDGKIALVTDDRVNPRELKRFREALRLAMRATMTTLQAQMDALQARVARADSVEQDSEQESAQEQVMDDVQLDEMEDGDNEVSFDESDSPSGSESDQEETEDAQGDSIAAVRLAKYERSIRDYKVDVNKGDVPRLRDHDTKTLLAGGPAPQPWSKETLKRFQQSVSLVHRRLDEELLLDHGVEEPDFRDEGGQNQYGWVLFEDAVLDACGIDMDALRSAQSTKMTGREDAGCVETSIRLLESIRDLCLMVRSRAHVKLAKKYSDILGELRTMATKKRGVARDTWRSMEEARAELTRLPQLAERMLEDRENTTPAALDAIELGQRARERDRQVREMQSREERERASILYTYV